MNNKVLAALNFNWIVEYEGDVGEICFQLRLKKRRHETIKQRCKSTTSVDMQKRAIKS